jgi:hypothetical protein
VVREEHVADLITGSTASRRPMPGDPARRSIAGTFVRTAPRGGRTLTIAFRERAKWAVPPAEHEPVSIRCWHAPLSEDQRAAVRAALEAGETVSALASRYETGRQTILRAKAAA